MKQGIEHFGHDYRQARKPHLCWLCGETISIGDRYFISKGTINGTFFAIKHCRKRCECAAEVIEQNPTMWPAVLHCETIQADP